MKTKLVSLFILTILFVLSFVSVSAQGIILPPPGVETDPGWLTVDYHRVNVDIDNQIAHTTAEFQFTNNGERIAEGTFLFPLPEGASVNELIMYIDGEPIEAKILPADEARDIYIETVRRLVDPALLEYVGSSLIQARVFPIPVGESRKLEISYSQVLEAENGLIQYIYPLRNAGSAQRVMDQFNISVNVKSNDPISNVYSPSHDIGIARDDDNLGFSAGFEANNYVPENDFSLYYGLENDRINVNLLTYLESADQDGFFMLLVQPPVTTPEESIIAKDVIIVIDQSGSMSGEKWNQARDAASYVLKNLNPRDRFNIVAFSTGWRIYSRENLPAENADEAVRWLNGLDAEGGTDINGALLTAQDMSDAERETTIIFLTDGLATEGETVETSQILENLRENSAENTRIFTFGVGDDVDTFLLDGIVQDHRGASSYVRPSERIDEEVASLYNKISSPVLTKVELTVDGVTIENQYPKELTDLFAGEQLLVVGRYRNASDDVNITLSGMVDGERQTFVYDNLEFPEVSGGEPFLAQLWATRRIGDLLNSIRLNGESDELVDSIVSLSIRYGIITPYTSFLIEEDDILSQQGREQVTEAFAEEAESLADEFTGEAAVDAADLSGALSNARTTSSQTQFNTQPAPPAEPASVEESLDMDGSVAGGGDVAGNSYVNPIQSIREKTFILQNGIWTDTTFEPDNMETEKITFLSDEYFELLAEHPEIGEYLAIGDQVIVVLDGTAYEVVPE